MTAVRWYRSSLEDEAAPNVRWYRSELTGSAVITPAVRWYRSSLDGTARAVVNEISDQVDVEPETIITITASLNGGGVADSWGWRVISGPSPGLTNVGRVATLTAPSHINGISTTIGVIATIGSSVSAEETFTIATLPQTEWFWTGTAWTPNHVQWAAA